jgi:hypothetical protein
MMWTVSDDGHVEVRMQAEGEQAIKVAQDKADVFFTSMVTDLTVRGVEVPVNELRYSFSKTRPVVTVIWRAQVEVASVPVVRAYLVRISEALDGSDDSDDKALE